MEELNQVTDKMEQNRMETNLEMLKGLSLEDYGRDFLLTWEKSDEEITATILLAEILQELHKRRQSFRVFESGLAVSIFRDKSTRTRYSFASATNALGLTVVDLDEEKSQIAHGETVRETANMISFLTEAIGIRDDMYLGVGHRYMKEISQAVDDGYREGTLAQRPGVINLQCDLDHPTQSMSDLAHLKRYFGSLENLRGKKIAMTWAYSPSYGKPLSVPQGVIGLFTRWGMDVSLAFPPGYDLVPEIVRLAEENATRSGGKFEVTHDMSSAFAEADVVYPKSWAPFRIMEQRTELLRAGDRSGLADLEKECLRMNAEHIDWECNDEKMALTKGGKALYMHCLPADISGVSCERGEVSKEVFERYRINTYHEAGHKPFVIAAMIFLSRLDDPVGKINEIVDPLLSS